MKILLAGFMGYVGNILKAQLENRYDLLCLDSRCLPHENHMQCDLTDKEAVTRLAARIRPDVVVHAVGNKDIGFCENNPEEAFRINCDTLRNISSAFGEKSRIIYISTDYVFDGSRGNYAERDLPEPATVYGKSKLCGEREGARIAGDNFVVIRASAIYDLNAAFPRFLHENLSSGRAIECFSDVTYSPTFFQDFVDSLEKLLPGAPSGERIFHSCGEATTRYDFATTFSRTFGFDASLVRKSSARHSGKFLFPDLSMNNRKTMTLLKVKTTPVEEALRKLKGN
jgi:dTDP-4-dehydrorhamnose reductase